MVLFRFNDRFEKFILELMLQLLFGVDVSVLGGEYFIEFVDVEDEVDVVVLQ